MKTKSLVLSGILSVLSFSMIAETWAGDLHAKVATTTAPKTKALVDLDNEFIKVFAATKKEWLAHSEPFIFIMDGKAILHRGGKKEEVTFITPEFDLVKTTDHAMLGVFAVLNRRTDKELDEHTIASLVDLKKAMVKAEPEISTYELPASTLDRQRMILHRGIAFIDSVLAKKKVSAAELKVFCRSMAPAVLANGDDAESFELHNLDAQVMKWKNQMSADEWNRLHVVVADSHMARTDDRYMQYFLFLLKEKEEGKRVIFCENAKGEEDCLKLLTSHITDELASEYFFNDPMRMHRDFLADGATLYLKRHYKYFLVTPKSKAKR